MTNIVKSELKKNKMENEIFYSLSQYDILNIKKIITELNDDTYSNIIIKFNYEEIDKIYKLLSTTYKLDNKEEIVISIWETFLCNKILEELQKKELVYYSQNLEKERNILSSFDIDRYIGYKEKRTTLYTINQIIQNQVSKKIRIHYFPDGVIIPIELQKIINKIFSLNLSFNNMLYTSKNSLHSYYKESGKWLRIEDNFKEIWTIDTKIIQENFS